MPCVELFVANLIGRRLLGSRGSTTDLDLTLLGRDDRAPMAGTDAADEDALAFDAPFESWAAVAVTGGADKLGGAAFVTCIAWTGLLSESIAMEPSAASPPTLFNGSGLAERPVSV